MSKFHSVVSRRDFMKGLGLAGAGLGAAAAASPVFNDLDELAASANDHMKLPWYVKERDYEDPTTPIDWDTLQRYDVTKRDCRPSLFATPEEAKVLIDYTKEEFPGWEPGAGGNGDQRIDALGIGAGFLAFGLMSDLETGKVVNLHSLLGRQSPLLHGPPEIPKWQGTPEENLQLVRAAVRFFGGNEVGCVPLNEKTKKLIWAKHIPGQVCPFMPPLDGVTGPVPLVYEDVDKAYMTDKKLVIPNKCEWVLVWTLRQSQDLTRRMLGVMENAAVFIAYSRIAIVENRIQVFLHGLGYQGLGGGTGEWGPAGAFATLAGMGELGRISYTITPKYGVTVRGMNRMITDLPLAPTKPIDAGMRKFCYTCGICADACPFGSIEKGEPSWETELPWQNSGYEAWRCDYSKCPHCPVCQGTCPFNSLEGSVIHDILKGTIATTPIFNGFFTNMHKTFGYGRKSTDDWWNLDRPQFDYDSTR